MGRFLLKRLAASLITLWLVVTWVFLIVNVLPGNSARQMLGAQAAESEVVKLNERLGLNRPVIEQYGSAMKRLFTFDYGLSNNGADVFDILRPAIWRSVQLATLALLITIPLGILAGIVAARRQNRLSDRAIVMTSVATSSVPDFVNAVVLSSLFCVTWRLGYVYAAPESVSGLFSKLRHLIFPALAMMLLYFGYIARMTRAGVIDALQSDYVRTASMKGLRESTVLRRHVLRNALPPAITVISTQVGYLLGSILGVEVVFNYQGIGSTVIDAVAQRDIPVLQAAVLLIAMVYVLASILADVIIAYLNPRVRLGGQR